MLRGVIQLDTDEIQALIPGCTSNELLQNKLNAAIEHNEMQVQISIEEAEQLLDCIDIEKIAADPVLQSAQKKLNGFIAKLREIKTEVN